MWMANVPWPLSLAGVWRACGANMLGGGPLQPLRMAPAARGSLSLLSESGQELPRGGEGRERKGSTWPCGEMAPHSIKVISPKTTFCPAINVPHSALLDAVCVFVPVGPRSGRVTCHLGGRWADLSKCALATTALSTQQPQSSLPPPPPRRRPART